MDKPKVINFNYVNTGIAILALLLALMSYLNSADESAADRSLVLEARMLAVEFTGPHDDSRPRIIGFNLVPTDSDMSLLTTQLVFDTPLKRYVKYGNPNWIESGNQINFDLRPIVDQLNRAISQNFEPYEMGIENPDYDWYTESCEGFFPIIIDSIFLTRGERHPNRALYKVFFEYLHYPTNGMYAGIGISLKNVIFENHIGFSLFSDFSGIDYDQIGEKCDFRELVPELPENATNSSEYVNFDELGN